MKRLYGKRNTRGFTLTEVLVTLAIVAVLAAIFIPGVAALRSRLKMTELDNNARQLFLSAQSELTADKSAGRLDALQSALAANTLSEEPEDYGDGSDWPQLRSVSGDSALCGSWFPNTCAALGEIGGSFCMEINPFSGDVYGVFYSENDAMGYSSVRGELSTRERSERKTYYLGYWGGSGVYSISDAESSGLELDADIVNAEELYLTVGCGDKLANAFGKYDNLAVTVNVEDESGNTATLTLNGRGDAASGADVSEIAGVTVGTDGEFSMTLLLDSMLEGEHFGDIMKNCFTASGSGVYPASGDNIDITVAVTYLDADNVTHNGSATLAANSLFASKATATDDSGTPAITADDTKTVAICVGYLRQLNNLRSAYYPYTDDAASTVTVSQTCAIDFAADSAYWTANTRGNSANPMGRFLPILNTALFDGNTVYDGGENTLSNFTIGGSVAGTGVFAKFGGAEIKNARIVNPVIVSPGEAAGALVGQITSNTKIENCGAYLALRNGKTAEDYKIVTGENYTGGLIGTTVSRVTIDKCFAAINILSTGAYTGGLVGSFGGGTISKSYASGDISGTTNVGGLVGVCQADATIANCYSTSDITAATNVGGMVGTARAALTATGSAVYGKITATGSGAFTGSGTATYISCVYLKQKDYNSGYDDAAGLTKKSYEDILTVNSARNSHPYDTALTGAFPFTMVTTEHWGDWPAEIPDTAGGTFLCYFEEYTDGTYGVYYIDADGNVQSTLDTTLDPASDKTISYWDYGILTGETSAPYDMFFDTYGGAALNSFTEVGEISTEFGDYTLYDFTYFSQSRIIPWDWYNYRFITDIANNRTLQVNGRYGASICDSANASLGTQDAPLGIRTRDQLSNLSLQSRTNGYLYFSQTHNIEVDSGIGNFDNNHGGYIYNGNKYQVIGLTKNMFSTIGTTSELINIRLSDVDIYTYGSTAALALTNYGTITGCKMYSGTVTSTGGNAAGLILTDNSGGEAVTHCGVFSGAVTSSRGSAAGLILTLTSGKVSDCTVGTLGATAQTLTVSANGTGASGMIHEAVSGTTVTGGRVVWTNVANTAGRAAGFITYNNTTIRDCSAENCVMSASDYSAGFCIDNTSTIADCHALNCSMNSESGYYPYASGFLSSNKVSGKVTECWASGVTACSAGGSRYGAATSAGFVSENLADISDCYTDLLSVSGPMAAGFVINNRTSGEITDCYAVARGSGIVNAAMSAAGFCLYGSGSQYYGGKLTNCYAAVSVTGGTAYGFGGTTNMINSNCLWVRASGFNDTLFGGVGTPVSLYVLKSKDMGTSWTLSTTAEQTHPATLTGQAYPYPRLSALEHWGDWPDAPVQSNKLGVATLMTKNNGTDSGLFGAAVDISAGSSLTIQGGNNGYKNVSGYYLLLSGADPTNWTVTAESKYSWYYYDALCTVSSSAASLTYTNTDLLEYSLYEITGMPWWFSVGDKLIVSDGVSSYVFTYTNAATGGDKIYTFAY